jgi:SAM-dependent methyltransferase
MRSVTARTNRRARRIDAAHPQPRPPAFEQSLNATGCTIHKLDEISQSFVDFAAAHAPQMVVDIGAGFGVATLAALRAGATVIANDIEPHHLAALESRVPDADRSRLTLSPGCFPDSPELLEESAAAVLLSRVLHFFDGPRIELSVRAVRRWLRPGGKAFVICDSSIFLNQPPLREAYERQKAAGHAWPGFVRGVHALLPQRARFIPDQLHYLDPQTLAGVFKAAGFEIERTELFVRDCGEEGPPRRCTGVIARKPESGRGAVA